MAGSDPKGRNASKGQAAEAGRDYTVEQGDCVESIAVREGLFWEKIWNHPKNSKLKDERKSPNVLRPGDVLHLPGKEPREEAVADGQRHRFKRKGVPCRLRMVLRDEDDQPRANERYVLDVDGQLFEGTTGGDGKVDHPIPPGARRATLRLGDGTEEYSFELGHVDPLSEMSGVQSRLNSLGFDCGPADGELNEKTREAIQAFQERNGLQVTGDADRPTLEKLEKLYGC